MNENVGFFESVSDEIDGLIKEFGHVKSLMILTWNVELEWDLGFGVVKKDAFGCSENSLDTEFWMARKVLLRVTRFYAAYKLPT